MPVPFKIPKRLQRLAPALEWLNNIPEEELDADPDLTFVDSFLRSLYGGLPFEEAEKVMESDWRALGKLVEANGEAHPWLYFFQGYFTPHILPYLLEQEDKEERNQTPPLRLHVTLPDNFQVVEDYGAVLARHALVEISLIPTAESVLDFKLRNLRQRADWAKVRERPASHVHIEYSFSETDWEPINGWKVTERQFLPANCKHITYLLKAPGGGCVVELACKDADFDESQVERHFRTLTVENTSSEQ